jgi:hypothetical protein
MRLYLWEAIARDELVWPTFSLAGLRGFAIVEPCANNERRRALCVVAASRDLSPDPEF